MSPIIKFLTRAAHSSLPLDLDTISVNSRLQSSDVLEEKSKSFTNMQQSGA